MTCTPSLGSSWSGLELTYYQKSVYDCRIFRLCLPSSVRRFAEKLPLRHYFKSLWQICEGLFSIWQNFDTTVAKMFYHQASFCCWKWPIFFKIISPSGHTAAPSISPLSKKIEGPKRKKAENVKFCFCFSAQQSLDRQLRRFDNSGHRR